MACMSRQGTHRLLEDRHVCVAQAGQERRAADGRWAAPWTEASHGG
jgi:hypothetical protein